MAKKTKTKIKTPKHPKTTTKLKTITHTQTHKATQTRTLPAFTQKTTIHGSLTTITHPAQTKTQIETQTQVLVSTSTSTIVSKHHGLSTGGIIGIAVVVGIFVLLILACVGMIIAKLLKGRNKKGRGTSASGGDVGVEMRGMDRGSAVPDVPAVPAGDHDGRDKEKGVNHLSS